MYENPSIHRLCGVDHLVGTWLGNICAPDVCAPFTKNILTTKRFFGDILELPPGSKFDHNSWKLGRNSSSSCLSKAFRIFAHVGWLPEGSSRGDNNDNIRDISPRKGMRGSGQQDCKDSTMESVVSRDSTKALHHPLDKFLQEF